MAAKKSSGSGATEGAGAASSEGGSASKPVVRNAASMKGPAKKVSAKKVSAKKVSTKKVPAKKVSTKKIAGRDAIAKEMPRDIRTLTVLKSSWEVEGAPSKAGGKPAARKSVKRRRGGDLGPQGSS